MLPLPVACRLPCALPACASQCGWQAAWGGCSTPMAPVPRMGLSAGPGLLPLCQCLGPQCCTLKLGPTMVCSSSSPPARVSADRVCLGTVNATQVPAAQPEVSTARRALRCTPHWKLPLASKASLPRTGLWCPSLWHSLRSQGNLFPGT